MPTSVVRDLGIYIDSDISMRSHVTKTVSACFAVLRQLWSIRRSVFRPVLQSLVTSLVLTRLDYGNATLAGIPLYLLKRLQSVMNSAARLVFSSSRYEHITPLLRQLHWLKAAERIDYKLAFLVYKCRQGVAPSYLADELYQPADTKARRRLRSASSSSLIVRRTRLSTVGDRAFPVTATRIWNGLPQHVTSAPSLAIFRSRLKTHLFRRCFPWLHRSLVVPDKWHVITDTLIVLFTYLLTYHHVIFPLKSWHSLALSIYVQTGWLQCYTFNGGLPVVAVHTAIWRPSVSCLLLPSDENETGTSGRQFVSFCTFTRTTGKQEKTWQKLTGTWSQAQYKGIGSGMGRFQLQGKAVQASSSAIRGWNKTCCNG